MLRGEQAGRRAPRIGDVAKVGREDLHVRDVAAGGEHGPVGQHPVAERCFGGLGVRKGVKVEELYREIRALRIYEGASEVQKIVIARQLLDGFRKEFA